MRRVAAVLTGTLVAGGLGVLVASPAQAATLTKPTWNPATSTVTATVTRGGLETIRITVSGPGAPDSVQDLSGFDATRVTVRRTGVTLNGTYRVVVTSNQAGGNRDDSVLVSDPPAVPSGVASAPVGVGGATITWNDNTEADLIGYSVVEDGATLRTLSGRCGGPCSTTLTDLTPGAHTFSVVATRRNGTGGQISSAGAATSATVAAPAPPPTTEPPTPGTPTEPGTPAEPGTPSEPGVPGEPVPVDPDDNDGDGTPNGEDDTPGTAPTGAPTASPSAGAPTGSASPRPTLVTTPRRGTASFGGFSGFGTALSVPGLKLGVAPPTLAGGEAEVPDGTFDPELAYDSEIRETSVAGSEGGGNALGPIGDAIDSEQLMRTLAAALILLLAGAHLRRWLSDAARPTA